MRVLITVLPGHGHFHPLLPIAFGLKRRGHQVVFASSPSYCPYIESWGFRTYGVGGRWLMAELHSAFPRPSTLPTGSAIRRWMAETVFAGSDLAARVHDLAAVIEHFEPAVLVRDTHEFAAPSAAQLANLPHASVEAGLFRSARESWAPVIGDRLNNLRERLGLRPDPELTMLYEHLHLTTVPPSYEVSSWFYPPTVQRLRPDFIDYRGRWRWPGRARPERDFVFVTVGSVIYPDGRRVLQAIIPALVVLGLRAIVVFPGGAPRELGRLPSHIAIVEYAPHSRVIPRARAVICHGGFNTVMCCLANGVPMVLTPMRADQPEHAFRCESLGVGVALQESDWNAISLKHTIDAVLRTPHYAEEASKLKAEIEALPRLSTGLAAIERLATTS